MWSALMRNHAPASAAAVTMSAVVIANSNTCIDRSAGRSERAAADDSSAYPQESASQTPVSPPPLYLASPSAETSILSDTLHGIPIVQNPSNNYCFCEGAAIRRRQTIRWLDETSTKQSLKSRYEVDWNNPLGEGAYGAVYLCTDRETGEQCALKKISKRYTNLENFQREMDALLRVRESGSHPNICRLRENFDEQGYYYLVLDLVSGGELFDQLARSGPYSEADAARLVREVASALAFIHGVGVVHADLKPENLMLSSPKQTDAVIKLVDFGCSEVLADKAYKGRKRDSGGNTPAYSPPEAFGKWRGALAPSLDMWSMGVIIYIMLTGMHPFDLDGTSTDEEIEKRIRTHKAPPLRNSPITAHLSDSAIDLIERLMAWRPRRRMTAMQMLEHPWVRGETARTDKMADSDKKLNMFRAFKSRLEAKVFSEWCQNRSTDAAKKASLIERAFKAFDTQDRGYVTTKDLNRTLSRRGEKITADEGKAGPLSLSGFSDLLSDHMNNKYYPRGHTIYKEGDKGDAIYFINSGTIQVSTKDGFETTLSQGELFGEGALLDAKGRRSATINCVTPVHLIRVDKEYFNKYIATSDPGLNLNLREKDRARKRNRAKSILRLQKNMDELFIFNGDVLFAAGDAGDTLYIIEEGKIDIKAKTGDTVFSLFPGDICGEHSLIMGGARNVTAICASDKCKLHEMTAKDFFTFYNSSENMRNSLREVCMRRDFLKALVLKTGKQFDEKHLREAFDAADLDRSGKIDEQELKKLLLILDPSLSDEIIRDVLQSLDLDSSGSIKWDEFRQIFSSDTAPS